MRGVAKLSLSDKLGKPRSVALLVKKPSIGGVTLLSSSARRSDGQACRTSHRSKACEIDPPLHRHEVDDGLVLRRERLDVSSAVLVRFYERYYAPLVENKIHASAPRRTPADR